MNAFLIKAQGNTLAGMNLANLVVGLSKVYVVGKDAVFVDDKARERLDQRRLSDFELVFDDGKVLRGLFRASQVEHRGKATVALEAERADLV